ncbi:hypothetical protein M233_09270 [Xylella fastidiosa subsp. multiplex Griffin-1]|nr:hypothetical protein M233_09270 [Xylella fastidiosa subsp. multiplex Griffin-1]
MVGLFLLYGLFGWQWSAWVMMGSLLVGEMNVVAIEVSGIDGWYRIIE